MTHKLTRNFRLFLLTIFVFGLFEIVLPQTETTNDSLTLHDIFASRKFRGKRFRGGQWAEQGPVITFTQTDTAGVTHLLSLDLEQNNETKILAGNKLKAGDVDKLITIEDYAYNSDRSKIMIFTDSEPVWRFNTKGFYYIYDFKSEKLTPLSARAKGYQMFAKFSPDGKYAAFVRNRNLYLVDLQSHKESELTANGSEGKIINGTSDWVYEEELFLKDGWSWSPDSRHIAFYQFDESNTNEFHMLDLREKKPQDIRFRFPLAGEQNSEVRIGIMDVMKKKARFFDTGTWLAKDKKYEYLPRMGWTPEIDGQHYVWIIRMNREQNKAEIVYGNPDNQKLTTILTEKDSAWVEVINFAGFNGEVFLTYLKDGKHFLWISERDGFKHIYLYKNTGELVKQVTSGNWEVAEVDGIDEKNDRIYFTASKEGPGERDLYVTEIFAADGAAPQKITKERGTHAIDMSNDFKYYIDTYSNINTPPVTGLYYSDGALIRPLEENKKLKETIAAYNLPKFEFINLMAADSTTVLRGYWIKPANFDSTRQYPLLIYTYGGPGVQQILDDWGGLFGLWHIFMAKERHFIVAAVDNRGAAGYGKAFASANHKNLGTLEPLDQIAAAKQLAARPYIDAKRIGIWGWSYGGYNTLMAMMKYDGPQTIKAGVAVAPGIDHELYDTIYTERYMSTPVANPNGYMESTPKNFIKNLTDQQKLLIVQGDLDDNVHYQQMVQLIAALQKANKQFDMMIYPGANHSMVGTGNSLTYLHLFTMITNFFVEHLD